MITVLKKFIEKYINLIEQKNWYTLYSHAQTDIPFQIGNLTTNLMKAGINPLDDLDVVLPEMFADSMLKQIELPIQISVIKRQAFKNCYVLKEITLPPSITKIEAEAFRDCYELDTIKYLGTVQHLKMSFPNWEHFSSLFYESPVCSIQCTDGEAELFI